MNSSSKFVMTSRVDGDKIVCRATMYHGPIRWNPVIGRFIMWPLTGRELAWIDAALLETDAKTEDK